MRRIVSAIDTMARLRLFLLGPLRLETAEGEIVAGIGAKAKAILAYLARQPNGHCDRDRLACLLWDNHERAEAKHALRQTLFVLRHRLGQHAGAALKVDQTTVRLLEEGIDLDLRHFEERLKCNDAGALAEACDLWRGSFCEGMDAGGECFDEWMLIERSRLDDLAAEAFRRLIILQADGGHVELATGAARRWVAINPLDDDAHATLIGLYRRLGWTGAARSAHQRCLELFRQELGEMPEDKVQAAAKLTAERDRSPAALTWLAAAGEARNDRAPHPLPLSPEVAVPSSPQRHASAILAAAAAAFMSIALLWIPAGTRTPQQDLVHWVSATVKTAAKTVAQDSGARAHLSSPVPPFLSTDPIQRREEITRALSLDPAYAHFYPAGC